MGIMNWEKVKMVDVDALVDDEESAEEYFDMIYNADLSETDEEASDPQSLFKLFQVTKLLLSMKALQYEAAVEEVEKYESGAAEGEIQLLRSELENYKKHDGTGTSYLRTEINQLEDKNNVLLREISELEKKLYKEQDSYDRLNHEKEALEANYQQMKKELDRAHVDIKEYQRQFATRQSAKKHSSEDMETVREVMTKKNREMSEYLDEIKNLQLTNDQLQEDIAKSKEELEQATEDMNSVTKHYGKLKTVLEETENVSEEMRKERDILRSQVQDMQLQLESKADGDDRLMSALNEKIAEWKDILAGKDEEIKEKEREIVSLEKKIESSQRDSDKQAMIKLVEDNAEKGEQIQKLTDKLELATREYKEITNQINILKSQTKDGTPSIYQQQQIQNLNATIQKDQMAMKMDKLRVEEAEKDVSDKDKEIAELVKKIIQYEQGQYGLAEAVKELKESRAQIRVRDGHIQELTQEINKILMEINDLTLENEEMRDRLGLESREELDLVAIRRKKAVKEEQAVALNSVLQKEVERLEEERVQLKKALRQQAIERGEKAVKLGLTAKDLEPPEEDFANVYTQEQERKSHPPVSPKKQFKYPKKDEDSDEFLINKNKELDEENKVLKEENSQFEIGLRELRGVLLQGGASVGSIVQIPAMDKLIAIIEQRNATGQYDVNTHLKEEIHLLCGRNEELRCELRNAQAELNLAVVQVEKGVQKIGDQETKINMLREANANVVSVNPLPLPEGVSPTSKEIIACLNEYLIQILQELSNKEEMCAQMQAALEEVRRTYSVAKHQQSILYKEHLKLKEAGEEQIKKLEEEKNELLLQKSQDAVRIQEFDKLIANIELCELKPKKLLAELTRKITVLKVNEKSLTRRYTIIQEVEKNLRKDNTKLRKEMLAMESAITTKIGDLERHKEMSMYKTSSLLKQLEDTVPALELEMANKQFNDLTTKYRDILQRENGLVRRSHALEELQAEITALQHTDKNLKQKLQAEKEKSYILEQTLNDLLHKMGKDSDGNPLTGEEISSLARKLATLEMKELNEKERADHATTKYEHLRTLTGELEKRNAELEHKFSEIAKINLDCQRIERELREQLEGSVPAELNIFNKELIARLELEVSSLKTECHKLREVADISQNQVDVITLQQQSQEKELTSVRKQLNELQMETDEKTIIAKLHQHIVAMQISESTAVRKYEVANKKLSKQEIQLMKLQQLVDEKVGALHHLRAETRSKTRFLKKTVQDLRRQFSGALTLNKQEKFADLLYNIQEKKNEYERKLQEIRVKHSTAEEHLLELKVKNQGLEELLVTLKDGVGAKKVAEWHNRMGDIKLEDMKLKRQIELDKEQIVYLERIVTKHESSIALLETDLLKQAKEFEDRQLLWEQHEVELERNIAKLENQQKDLAEAARKFEEATGSIPDNSLPIANQLDIAVSSIKQHIKTIIVTRAECKRMSDIHEDYKEKLRQIENSLMEKDKIINELRLRLPFNERDMIYENAQNTSVSKEESAEAAQAFRVAQATIESMKIMLEKKDENITKYQGLAKTAREQLKSQMEGHQQEIKVLQDRLQLEVEEHVKKMKRVHHDYLAASHPNVPTNKQIQRLLDVEELLVHQDGALGVAAAKYDAKEEEIKAVKEDTALTIESLNQQIQKQDDENKIIIDNMKNEIKKEKSIVHEKELEIEVLNKELEVAREASKKAPSKTMRNLVERLRDQLAKKDKEQKALSQALIQIQSDMVSTAEDNVKAHAKKIEGEMSVQTLIEKKTAELTAQNQTLQTKFDKATKELKKKKETEMNLALEVDGITKEINKKDEALRLAARELEDSEKMRLSFEQLKIEHKKLLEQNRRKEKVIEPPMQSADMTPLEVHGVDLTDLDDRPVKEERKINIPEERAGTKDIGIGKEEVIRWEESKKWQKKVDTIKGKLKDKTDECEKLNKTNTMIREQFSRLEKDKLTLQNKMKTLSRGLPVIQEGDGDKMSLQNEEMLAGLKQRIFKLESENNDLVKKLNLDRDCEVQELRIQLSQQNESIHAMETQLCKKQKDEDPNSYNWIMEREKSLKKEMLEIRKENMELVFEKEQAAKDVPRLKSRVVDLEGYVDVLKHEIEKLEKKEKARKNAMGTGMGGQSVEELERVIGATRRVVERLQVENESLKKQVGKTKPRPDLAKENQTLKQQVQKLKQVQALESKKVSPYPRATAKLAEENNKLIKELQKAKEEKEDLKVEKKTLEARIESLLQSVEEKDKQLQEMEDKTSTRQKQVEFMVNKDAKAEQLELLHTELEKKNNVLKEIKVHLKSAAEREASLMRQVDTLEGKVAFLQDFPPGIRTESDAAKCLQQTRLQTKRLEAEKEELTFELNRLRKLTNNGSTVVDVTQDEILTKLQNYDRMMEVEVELRMKIKMMEMERDKLLAESHKLKSELSAFDPAFFEELEDLKYNYKVSIERNVLYERQLRQLSKQFGVQVNIPDEDDNT